MLLKIKNAFRRLIVLNETPERIALAFALGVFIAFSPLIGFHTVLGLLASFIFGLNRFAILLGLLINNPYTLIPIYAAGTWVGGLFVGLPSKLSLPHLNVHALISKAFWMQLISQWQLIKPMILGSTILSCLAAIVSYGLCLYLIRQMREREIKSQAT
jgi:uncharacterized protein